jgi:dTDP-glucose 4,6-dehydratase
VPETIFVLGSNSFSGAHFVAHCLRLGHNVVGVSRSPEPHTVFLPFRTENGLSGTFTFHQLDLNLHSQQLFNLIQQVKPTFFVNFAAQSMVAESWENPEHWMMTNVVGTVRLHEQLRTCRFIKTYVHISTPEVYGTCEGLVPEHINCNPSTPYAVSRAAADMSLMSYFRRYNFPVVFTRAANVFGPGQQLYRIIPRTILSFLTGQKLPLHGGGHSVRSFIHIGDVCDGTYHAMQLGKHGNVYHLSTTRNISIRGVVEMLAERLNISFEDAVTITDDRPGKDAAYLLDSSKARTELAWEPRTTLEDGLDETIQWVRENIEILKQLPIDYIHKP